MKLYRCKSCWQIFGVADSETAPETWIHEDAGHSPAPIEAFYLSHMHFDVPAPEEP